MISIRMTLPSRWPLIGVLTLWAWLSLTLCVSAASPKRVLILNPFGRDVEPFSSAVSGFRTTLARELGESVDFHEIPLELGRFTGQEGEAPLVAFLKDRIKNHPVDLVVPIGGAGVQFAARHREVLFPETQILAVAAEPRMVPAAFLEKNATLVTQRIDLPGMVEDILNMQPDTSHIAVVFGSSKLEMTWLEECRREFEKFEGRVKFIWMTGLTLAELIEKCSKLPPRSFVLHALFIVDAVGVPSERNEALRRLHESSNAPIFAPFSSEFGMGAIGGRLFQNSELGVQGAQMALRILRGENAGQLPPLILETATPVYDWRELRRWKIPEANLPSGSAIQFRQPGFWERYHWLVIGVSLFGLVQMALIIGLLVNRSQRLRAEAEATLIADISAKFVNLPASEVDREIMEAERRICDLLDLDVAGLWQWTQEAEPSLTLTHLHGEVKVPPPDDMKAAEFFPWFQEALAAGRLVGFSSLDKLPPAAARDRESFRAFGIQSCLTLPLSVGGEPPIGALGLNATRKEHSWSESQIARLQMIAQIFTNALARKRADQALRESELRLSLAADAAGAGLWVLDWDKQLFWITDRARTIFGYPPDVMLNMARFEQSVHPQDLDRIHKIIAHAVNTGEPLQVEYRIQRDDGATRWIASQGRPLFKSNGEPERLLGLSMDITGRKEEEERIRAEEARLGAGFDLAGLGYYEFHFGDDTCFIDERFHQICGIPAGRQQASPTLESWMSQVHPDDLQLVLGENGKLHSGEAERVSLHHRHIHPTDGTRWLHHFSGVAERNASGDVLRTFGVIRDITEQRHAEMEALELRATLAHSGRVTLLGQLASALAHELSQPLGAILRNAEAAEIMLQDASPDIEEMRAIIDDILRDDHRAGQVIDKLRALLKKGSLDVQPVDLAEVIDGVLSLVQPDATSRQVQLSRSLAADLPMIWGDKIHLQQVLINLLVNAMDVLAGQDNGQRGIWIHARTSDGKMVEVRVCDNGPGIPGGDFGRLFEPFFTTKQTGMGMGLPVSKTIIEAHKGQLWAENRPEGGACFCFTVRIAGLPV